jgi:glucose/mannose-6-phosphate isomerase
MIKELITNFPNQLKKAIEIGKNIKVNQNSNIQNIVVAGLGGSGIGANIVENWLYDYLNVPYTITKSYDIPNFVNENTLFVACSFSGGTEETLSAVEKAIAKKAKIFAITSGGKLLEIAKENNFDYVQIPNEAPCPRAFLGYSLTQLLFTFYKYNLIANFFEQDLQRSILLLENQTIQIQSWAKDFADKIFGKNLYIYGEQKTGALLTRFQQQINENSKQLCHINLMPEMNHNELVGWGLDKKVYENILVIILKTSFDHPRTQKRMELCKPIFAQKASNVIDMMALGDTPVVQGIYLLWLFDWISWYLSELNQVDAFEINVINHLKNELAKF